MFIIVRRPKFRCCRLLLLAKKFGREIFGRFISDVKFAVLFI